MTRKPGGVPTMFVGGIGRGHTKVRQRMCQLLESDAAPVLLDDTARRFLAEARKAYLARNLSQDFVIDQGREVLILTWLGCATNEALACLLRSRGLKAAPTGPGTEVHQDGRTINAILEVLMDAATDEPPALDVLLEDAANLQKEKWDWALPAALLRKD